MKAIALFTTLLFMSIGTLWGGVVRSVSTYQEECDDPCCPPRDPCAKCAPIWPSRGPDWMITPNAGPCVACGWDVHLTAEFLYWTARQDHLGFTLAERFDDQDNVISKGKIFHPDWNFRPGFKIGFGILQDHDGWDVYANYTWFHVRNTKRKVTAGENDQFTHVVIPLEPFFPQPGDFEEASWELDFNVVDFEVGRNFFISRCLTLRPHFGLKGTWQKQDFPFFSSITEMTTNFLTNVDQKSDYWGIGPCAGLDSSWHFGCFSFLGEVAVSGLWERFELDYKETTFDSSDDSTTIDSNFENEFQTIKPVLELFLGFRWETWFCCDNYHFGIDGGWEIQWWGDQNQFYGDTTETLLGDLYLHGLTLKFRLDF